VLLAAWRPLAFTLVACVALSAPAGAAVDRRTSGVRTLSALEHEVLVDVNAIRAQHGLRPLRLSERLTAAADRHSREMARGGFFAHESADGSAFWKRIERFYGPAHFRHWSVGENLLWSSPDVDRASAMRMWMGSAPHRANLLTARWREIGVSAVHVASAPGVYGDQPVTIVTADFGVRQ
jgi:uncharacterized protein YkwD